MDGNRLLSCISRGGGDYYAVQLEIAGFLISYIDLSITLAPACDRISYLRSSHVQTVAFSCDTRIKFATLSSTRLLTGETTKVV